MEGIKRILVMIGIVGSLSMVMSAENPMGVNKPVWEKIDVSGTVESVYMAPSPKNPDVNQFCVRLIATDGKTYEVRCGRKELPIKAGDQIEVRGGISAQFGDVIKAVYIHDNTTGFEWHRMKNKMGAEGGGFGSGGGAGGEYKSGSK